MRRSRGKASEGAALIARQRLDRRETLAASTAAIAQNGAATLFGLAIEKTVLPFAADFRWLILPFHVLSSNLLLI